MRRRVVVVLAVAALFGIAGCLGGGGGSPETTTAPEPTTTGTPTTDTPTTTAPPETTTDTTTTITPEPQPDLHVNAYRQANGAVYDGEATFTIDVTNTGATATYAYNVTVERQAGGDFDRTRTGTLEVGANEVISQPVEVEFRATGTYTVYLNGEEVTTVEVRGLRSYSSGGDGDTQSTTTAQPTTADGPGADVSGETNPQAE